MAKEINNQLGGEWIHTQDDNFPPFFDAVGKYSAPQLPGALTVTVILH